MTSLQSCTRKSAFVGLCLAAVNGAYAQVSSINSAFIDPRVFDDVPAATLTTANNYPSGISFTEANVSSSSGFANRDVWYFSNNGGTSAYQFQANDYFSASFNVTLTGGAPGLDIETGFLFSNPSGNFGGDLQLVATGGGVVFQGGGPSYYPFSPAAGGFPGAGGSVPNYVEGQAITMTMNYVVDPITGKNAFEYAVNGQLAASSAGDPYFDLGPGQTLGSPGDTLGGYFQIQTAPTSNPNNTGEAQFTDITITPIIPEPSSFLLLGAGIAPLLLLRRRRN
jgi:hypothetical protein